MGWMDFGKRNSILPGITLNVSWIREIMITHQARSDRGFKVFYFLAESMGKTHKPAYGHSHG